MFRCSEAQKSGIVVLMADNTKNGRPAKEFEAAKIWLLDYLADGDKPALIEESFGSLKVDFSWASLRRAKAALKIQSCHHQEAENPSQWFWTVKTRAELIEERMRDAEAIRKIRQSSTVKTAERRQFETGKSAVPFWTIPGRVDEIINSGDRSKIQQAATEAYQRMADDEQAGDAFGKLDSALQRLENIKV